ncbi:hypothetical protein J4406_01415 [Candidatus Woesearchaeota archaeon]|nr:hypothetical protein [Candidatus Woesearchaeota archaeon]
MVTTIQISEKLQNNLKMKKLYEKESYEEVIWDLIEDTMELSKEAKVMLRKAEEDIKSGRVHSFEKVKRELNL